MGKKKHFKSEGKARAVAGGVSPPIIRMIVSNHPPNREVWAGKSADSGQSGAIGLATLAKSGDHLFFIRGFSAAALAAKKSPFHERDGGVS